MNTIPTAVAFVVDVYSSRVGYFSSKFLVLLTLSPVLVKIKMYLKLFFFTCFANTNKSYCLIVLHVVGYSLSLILYIKIWVDVVVLDIIDGGLTVVLGQSPSMVLTEVATRKDKASCCKIECLNVILKMMSFKQE